MATTAKKEPRFRSAYNYDTDVASWRTGTVFEDESRAKQSEAEATDINFIMKRFGITGTVNAPSRLPTYGDFVGVSDYQTALNALIDADNVFMELPANIRRQFDNDPQKFVDFCEDPANIDELRKLGLAPAPEVVVEEPSEPPAAPAGGSEG